MWPQFFECTAVELEQNLHCTRWVAINRVLDVGYWVSHLRRLTLLLHTLRLKLHRFDFSPCLLQTCLYNIWTTNRLSGVWALSFKYVIITDSSWSPTNLLSTDARYLVIVGPTWCAVQYGRFLPRDAMLIAVRAVVVYLSVHLSGYRSQACAELWLNYNIAFSC